MKLEQTGRSPSEKADGQKIALCRQPEEAGKPTRSRCHQSLHVDGYFKGTSMIYLGMIRRVMRFIFLLTKDI